MLLMRGSWRLQGEGAGLNDGNEMLRCCTFDLTLIIRVDMNWNFPNHTKCILNHNMISIFIYITKNKIITQVENIYLLIEYKFIELTKYSQFIDQSLFIRLFLKKLWIPSLKIYIFFINYIIKLKVILWCYIDQK